MITIIMILTKRLIHVDIVNFPGKVTAEESIKIYKNECCKRISDKAKEETIEFEGDVNVLTDTEFEYLDIDLPQSINMKSGKYRMKFTKVE